MLNPTTTIEHFEALDCEIVRLRTENARLRAALRRIRDNPLDAHDTHKAAWEALTETEAT